MTITNEMIQRVTAKMPIEEDAVRQIIELAFGDTLLPTATEADLRRHIRGIERARIFEKDQLQARIDEQGAQLKKIRLELEQYREQRDPWSALDQIFRAVGLNL